MSVLAIRTTLVKRCRKPWTCDYCGRKFPLGTAKVESFIKNDDMTYTWRSCTTCDAVADEFFGSLSDHWDEGISPESLQFEIIRRFGSIEAADTHFAPEVKE